jgi:DNA-binding MarR family transcriptional regulator
MARDDNRGPDQPRPQLIKGDEGGPLSRQLVNVKLVWLADFLTRASSLRYPRASGLSDFEWRVLAWVCETPDLSLGELAAHLHRGVAQTSRTVKRLVGMGLVQSRGRGGGPGVVISPAPRGRIVYEPMTALAAEADRALLSGLSKAEVEELRRVVTVLTENALAILAKEQRLSIEQADRSSRGGGRASDRSPEARGGRRRS